MCLILTTSTFGSIPGPASVNRVFLAGNDNVLWFVRVGPEVMGEEPLAWFAVKSLSGKTDGETSGAAEAETSGKAGNEKKSSFFSIPIQACGPGIEKTVTLGTSIHLFYVDGTHRSVRLDREKYWLSPAENTQERLPDSAIPLALAEDRMKESFYAVVPGRIARALEERDGEPEEDVTTNGQENNEETEETAEKADNDESKAVPEYAILKFNRGTWSVDRYLPSDIDGSLVWDLAVQEGNCTLIGSGAHMPDSWFLLRSPESGSWEKPRLLERTSEQRVLTSTFMDKDPVFILADSTTVSSMRISGTSEREIRTHFSGLPESLPDKHERISASPWMSDVAIAISPKNAEPILGIWNVTSGTSKQPLTSVDELIAMPETINNSRFTLIPFIVLALAMVIAFTRYRDSIQNPVVFPDGMMHADLFRRFLAFVGDCVVTSPMLVPIFYVTPTELLPPGDVKDQVGLLLVWITYNQFWRVMLGLTLFIAYSTLFESLLGATVGKLLLRCRVCDAEGNKPPFKAILIRNLLKYIELFPIFQLLPSGVLIIWTQNRQRIGDIFAGTYVVEKYSFKKNDSAE